MSCNQGREHTLNSVQTTRDMSDMGVEFLVDSVSSSLYKSWKVQRTRPRLKLELATRMPANQALELLHSRLHHVQVRPRQHSLLPTPQGRQSQHCRPRARGAATAPRREKGSQRRPPVSLPTSTHHRSIVQESVSISELPNIIMMISKLILNNNAIVFRIQLSPCCRDGRAGHHPHQDQLLRNNSDSDLTNFELFCLMSAVYCTH